MLFIRYQPIINNWQAFQDTLLQPLPTCIWTNTLRTTPEQLADFLAADGLDFEPLAWYPGGFKLPHTFKPGLHWTFLAGLCHVQEEAALLPVIFLDPQPGERVLDLCAAPGNKTAQIAIKMNNQGTVVANDINGSRMRALRQAIERLGLVNVTTTNSDGANYPRTAGLFDKVLVDVPCSCEGTSRKEPAVIGRTGPAALSKKLGLQKALLRKAVQRCKPGGRIVYATCTYAPEENEEVVDAILREFGPDTLQIVPAQIEELTTSPGLTTWQDRQFHPSLRHTMRIWPHQNDTGGFYIAVIEKLNLEPVKEIEPAEGMVFGMSPEPENTVSILMERFGIPPDTFDPYILFQHKGKSVYLVNQNHHPPVEPKPDAVGVTFMKTRIKYPKLSTAGALKFGPRATKNYINLTPQQVEDYTRRRNFEVSAEQSESCTGTGYVLVRYRDFVLGVGVYYPDEAGGGVVQSMFPKGWSPNKG